MMAYYMSNPDKYGYRQRMLRLWRKDHPNSEMNEQRLADQRRVIEKHKLLSTEELEDILRQIRRKEEVESEQIQPEMANTVESSQQPQPTIEPQQVRQTELGEFGLKIIENNVPRRDRQRLPPLKGVDKHKLDALIQKANIEIANMEIGSLDALNDIAYATAAVITSEMGLEIQTRRKEEPAWKRRIKTKISKLRRDLSQIESWRSGKLQNECVQRRLETKYWLNAKGLAAVAEELKQRLTAQSQKPSEPQG